MGQCEVHPGVPNNKGYIARPFGGRMEQVHRIAWIKANGPIPAGLEIDHVCRNRACANVAHLRLVTHRDNLLASENTLAGKNARKTRCANGHSFDAENTHTDKQGKRHCRACDRQRKARRAKKGKP